MKSYLLQRRLADVTGDGKGDLVVWYPWSGVWQVAVSDGARFSATGGVWLENWAKDAGQWRAFIGDVNGDGKDDLIVWHPSTGGWQVALSNGTKFTGAGVWLQNWAKGFEWVALMGDFNGDGKSDLVVWDPSSGGWQVALSDGTKFTGAGVWLQNWAKGKVWVPLIGDVNGDGKDDLIVWHGDSGQWQVALSDGTRFIPTGGNWLQTWKGSSWLPLIGDVNRDGRDDLIVWQSTPGEWHVALSEGQQFVGKGVWLKSWAFGKTGPYGWMLPSRGGGTLDDSMWWFDYD